MKRTRLNRKTPLRTRARLARKSYLPRRRKEPRRSGRVRDRDYMLWVKTLSCLLAHLGECEGVTEADHAGRRGLGQKCSDRETIPLCTRHHRDRHAMRGAFLWPRCEREWLDAAIAATQERAREEGVLR